MPAEVAGSGGTAGGPDGSAVDLMGLRAYDRETPSAGQPAPRQLGDAWRGWDARDRVPAAYDTGPGLFLALLCLWALLAGALLLALLWLAAPRLIQAGLPRGALVPLGIGVVALLPGTALLFWLLARRSAHPTWVARGGQRLVVGLYPAVETLGRLLGIQADRVGHSFLELANRLVPARRAATEPPLLMLLAPRCLRADVMRQVREIAARAEATCCVVGGGEQARAVIAERNPAGILAIACERDLVAGVRDVAPRRPVVTVANRRPEGPCRNSIVDLAAVEHGLRRLSALVSAAPLTPHADTEAPAGAR